MSRIALLISGLVAAVAIVAAPTSGMAVTKLTGTVGPGFTITLKKGSAKVRTLPAGRYSITVRDLANNHNFHLTGPGVNRQITSVSFKGTKTVALTLKKGTYKYVCDPHKAVMKGSFRVT